MLNATHATSGELAFPDAKIRWGVVRPDAPVKLHAHSKGHVMTVIGVADIITSRGTFRIVNDFFYTFAGEAHGMRAVGGPAKYTCVGERDG